MPLEMFTLPFGITLNDIPLLRVDVLLLIIIAILVLIWAQNSAWLVRCVRKYRLFNKKLRRRLFQGKHK